jgi:hypothetical protein
METFNLSLSLSLSDLISATKSFIYKTEYRSLFCAKLSNKSELWQRSTELIFARSFSIFWLILGATGYRRWPLDATEQIGAAKCRL